MSSLGGRRKTLFYPTHKHTSTKNALAPMQQKGGLYGEENSNEAKLCNVLNLAAGLSTQVSVHIAPSPPCIPCCAQMSGAVLC